MFMPFDAAHWCAVSQVNLSIVLCLRYHGHVTVRILLIASCKKDQGYSKSSLNLTQIHIWTPWFDIWFFRFVKINTSNKMTSFGLFFLFLICCVLKCLSIVFANQIIWCKSRRLHVHALWCRSLMCSFPGQPLNFAVLKVTWTCNRSIIVDCIMQKGLGL